VSVVSALLELFFHADAEAFFVIGVALQGGVFAKVSHGYPFYVFAGGTASALVTP
jgi:hypothetical protein